MLDQVRSSAEAWDRPVTEPRDSLNTIDLDAVLAAARRQLAFILGGIGACLLLAIFYAVTATRIYTASVDILIDSRTFDTTSRPGEQAQLVFNSGALDSQAEILKSAKIAAAVVDELKLTEDADFVGRSSPRFSIVRAVWSLVFSDSGESEERQKALKQRAVETFRKRLKVARVDKTYVIRLGFSSPDAERAAAIANALADAYLVDQLDAKYEAAHRASEWLQDRIQELRQKLADADLAVQKYREVNNLITADGQLIKEQQLSELNTQLTAARAERARAEARYKRIQSIIQNKQMDAAVSESLDNPVIVELRNKYLEVAKRSSELAARLDPQHVQVINLQREMEGYQKQIFAELGRIAESRRSDMQIAESREESLTESIAKLVRANADDNRTLVKLREMEREAESYRALYQDFLERYQALIQQQSFPITEARIITRASKPLRPSAPRIPLVLAIGLVGGVCVGTGLALLREHRDRTFRTGDHVRAELGVESLGVVPLQAGVVIPGDTRNGKSRPAPTSSVATVMRASVTMPMSRLADTLRTVKVAVDLGQPTDRRHVIGVVSTTSGEGKTFVAANLAMLLGNMGAKTLLIDGDLRHCGLSRALAAKASPNLIDVLAHGSPLQGAVRKMPEPKVWLLPTSTTKKLANSSQALGSSAMRSLLTAAANHFEYVVIDLPPLGALVDARAAAPSIGSFLFVIEWGKTSRNGARNVLLHNELVYEKCVGALLNKVDPTLISRYVADDPYSYGCSSYERYGTHDVSLPT